MGQAIQEQRGPATGGAYSIEPHVAEQVFNDLARESHVPVHFDARLAAVKKEGARITEFTTEDGTIFRAAMFIDATYEGDLMAKAGVSYTLLREGNAKYGRDLQWHSLRADLCPADRSPPSRVPMDAPPAARACGIAICRLIRMS
ncbi:MAG: FAD-dependent oxidoreductase [Chthoniobacter sp.]